MGCTITNRPPCNVPKLQRWTAFWRHTHGIQGYSCPEPPNWWLLADHLTWLQTKYMQLKIFEYSSDVMGQNMHSWHMHLVQPSCLAACVQATPKP